MYGLNRVGTICLDTNLSGHKRVWSQTCVGTNLSGHNRVRSQSCLHYLVWAQSCLGTNVSGDKRDLKQMCLGTNVREHKRAWHKRVWAQSCGHSRVGPIMYGHKRGGTVGQHCLLPEHTLLSKPSCPALVERIEFTYHSYLQGHNLCVV